MQNTSKSHVRLSVFLIGVALIVILSMLAVHLLGFGEIAAAVDKNPERLRDFTFPVWHSQSVREHGFLVFLSQDGFAARTAYANHPTVYLWFMDALNHFQHRFPMLTMRLTSAWLAMLAMALATGYVVYRCLDDLSVTKLIVLGLGFCYIATLPTYWIAVGKFNVDNGFIFLMPALIMLSYFTWKNSAKGGGFWFWATVTTLVMPIAGVLFAIGLSVQFLGRDFRLGTRTWAAPVLLAALSTVLYLEPVLVLKLLGFNSMNSSWVFRAGLDGDTRGFSNALNSVLFPQVRRPFHLVVIPVALVVVQWLAMRGVVQSAVSNGKSVFVINLFAVYALTLLFWPQAVSIHPYLYDAILIGPVAVWVMVNFAGLVVSERTFPLWCFALGLLIMFNLTTVAQATHSPPYPQWNLTGDRDG
ncbi:hypothetical protein K6V72_00380 [Ralstonia insidiosa]|uniref:Uncharacterized protein n=2 Tax=Burkholderiaceae TaxID=119060 RepID=A0A191ZWB0_9RALS|nr:hypothetical protein [Ralstonia insidiosa]ANJ72389.1 hypothetical protein A9Y76_07855 [Ralstonia insidiosa]KAB0472935.1 hypothetical protein F7R11_10400 [Ralstonia insidiosa]MBY4907437.1 hypothetical protein [Ralstonia insidiosa]